MLFFQRTGIVGRAAARLDGVLKGHGHEPKVDELDAAVVVKEHVLLRWENFHVARAAKGCQGRAGRRRDRIVEQGGAAPLHGAHRLEVAVRKALGVAKGDGAHNLAEEGARHVLVVDAALRHNVVKQLARGKVLAHKVDAVGRLDDCGEREREGGKAQSSCCLSLSP